jgi:drug/metabolite transporter (DMT)-like permease
VAVAAIAFSGKAVIIKLAYRYGVDAVTLLALRMVFSAPFFALLGWWAARGKDIQPLSMRDRGMIVGLGLVGYYLASYFDFLGLQYVTAALERLLLFIHPTFVVLFSALLFARRITGRDIFAIVVCYVGIAIAFGHDVATQPGNVVLGSFWVLLSALFYAAYLTGSGRIVHRVGTLRFATYAGLVSSVAVVTHFLLTRDGGLLLSQAMPVYWLSLLMAVVSTVLPIVLTMEGIRRVGASHASIVASVGPLATIALGAVFLDEAITWYQLVGAALVLTGVLAISLAKGK